MARLLSFMRIEKVPLFAEQAIWLSFSKVAESDADRVLCFV